MARKFKLYTFYLGNWFRVLPSRMKIKLLSSNFLRGETVATFLGPPYLQIHSTQKLGSFKKAPFGLCVLNIKRL